MSKNVFVPEGIIPVLPTPFTKDDKINFEVYGQLIDYVIENGVHAICTLGSTGEYSTMSSEERKSLMKFAPDYVNGRIPVILGTATHSLARTLELTGFAQEVGADAVMITTPYYLTPNREGMYKYYKTIAETYPELGIVLYNVPACTNVAISVEEVVDLAKIPNIVSIKDTTDLIHTARILKEVEHIKNFTVATGEENLIMPNLAQGGTGGTGIISSLIPKEIVRIHDLIVKDNNVKEAAKLNMKLTRLYTYTEIEPNPAPAKAVLNMLGFDFGVPRLPVLPCSEELKGKMKEELIALGYAAK